MSGALYPGGVMTVNRATFPALRSMLMYNKCIENLLVSHLNIM